MGIGIEISLLARLPFQITCTSYKVSLIPDTTCTTMFLSKLLNAADHPYLMGKGGRMGNNNPGSMQGMTMKSLKHHTALQPLFIIMGAGIIFVAAYIGRLASKTTDVNWSKNKDLGDHMGYYNNRQFKWFNPSGTDYSKISDNRPNYRE